MNKNIIATLQLFIILFSMYSICSAQESARTTANRYYQLGAELMVKGDIKNALSNFEKSISKDPSFNMPYLILADFYFKEGEYDKAISYYETFLSKKDRDSNDFKADVYKRIGDCCVMRVIFIKSNLSQDLDSNKAEKKYIDKAIDSYKKTGSSDFRRDSERKKLSITLALSYIYAISGDLDSSEKLFEQAESENISRLPEYYFYKGVYFKFNKSNKEAIESFNLVEKNSPFYNAAKAEIQSIVKKQKTEQLFYFTVTIIVIVILIGLFLILVSRKRSRVREGMDFKYGSVGSMDNTFDGVHFSTKKESVSFAIDQLNRHVNMPMVIAFMPDKDEIKLVSVPKTSIGMMSDIEISLKMSMKDVQNWVTAGSANPFIYKIERRESLYIRAFPNSHTELENLMVRIGIPLITDDRVFIGIIYFANADENNRTKNELRKNFEQKYFLLKEAAKNLADIVKASAEQESLLFDKETGMHNSRYYYSAFPKILNEVNLVSLLIFEMDGFEALGEKLGTVSASRLRELTIKAIFQVLEDRGDFCQIGEARFAIILPNRSFKESTSIAEEIRQALTKVTLTYQGDPVTITCAVGTYPGTSQSPERLDTETREALEEGLKHGGNLIVSGDRKPILNADQVSKTQVISALTKDEPVEKQDEVTVKKPLFISSPKSKIPESSRNTLSPHKLKTHEAIKASFKSISTPIPVPKGTPQKTDPSTGFALKAVMERTLLAEAQFLQTSPRESAFLYFSFDKFFELKDPGKLDALKKLTKELAPSWNSLVDNGGIISKLEENGFAMFLPEKNLKQGLEIADKLRSLTRDKVAERNFTLSIGVSSYPGLTDNFKNIVIHARGAMTKAQSSGGDKILYVSE